MAGTESTAVTRKPLYMAPMMFCDPPRRTKYVPMIEVTMQTPPISRGRAIRPEKLSMPFMRRAVSTMVAPTVTT